MVPGGHVIHEASFWWVSSWSCGHVIHPLLPLLLLSSHLVVSLAHQRGLVVPVFPVVSPSSFHPPTTPQAVAREAGGGWCIIRSYAPSLLLPSSLLHIVAHPTSREARGCVVVTWRRWSIVSSPLPIVVPPTTHPTSSCLRGWGQVVCHGDIAALVVVCHCPPSLSPHLPLLFVRLLSSVYAPTIHPTSSGSQARGGCWSCWSCCGRE